MTWQTFAFLIVAALAFGYSGLKFKTLIDLMKRHQGKGPKIGDIPARVGAVFLNVIGQSAVLRKKWIGGLHAMIFWGFIIITIGTVEQFVSTLYNGWNFEFIGEEAYSTLVRIQDFFTWAVLAAVIGAAIRRYFYRPPALEQTRDAGFVLLFTGGLMVSIVLMNSFHIVSAHPTYWESFFLTRGVAARFARLDPDDAANLFTAFKWLHMMLVMGFSVYIPTSKHLHIVAAGPNTFLKKLSREKAMKPIDFANESVTQYGAAKVTDLTWKDALDYYSCTECGRCEELCPAWNTGKPLSPKKIIRDLKNNVYANKPAILAGKYDEVGPLVDGHVTEDVLWACTSCRACEIACPVFIEQTDKIYEARRNLVMMESKFPAEVQTVFKNMETNASPWAFAASDRANWIEGMGVKTMAEDSAVDVLLWVGCAGSFDDRNKKVLRAFVNILKKADVKFAILGTEEQCTGDPARRIGNEYLFQTLAAANVETLNRYGMNQPAKKVVTACPHCFNTLKNEYKDFGGTYQVFHHSQYIASLIREGKVKPTKEFAQDVTFHDSCYLGRWNSVYEQPRSVLSSVPGVKLHEMKSNHDQSLCCGAGGGRMWMEETIGKRVNVARTEQALETGAKVIASSCPFCMTMLNDGVKVKEKQDAVRVMDIAEVVEQSLV